MTSRQEFSPVFLAKNGEDLACENPAVWSEFNLHSALSNCLHISLLHRDRGAHWAFNLHSNAEVLHNEAFFESKRWRVVVSTPGSNTFSPLYLLKDQPKQYWKQRSSRPLTPPWEHISNECSPVAAWWKGDLGSGKCSPEGFTSREHKPRNLLRIPEKLLKVSDQFCVYFAPHLTRTLPQNINLLCIILWESLESWIIPQDAPTCFNPWPREYWRIKLTPKWPLDIQNTTWIHKAGSYIFLMV